MNARVCVAQQNYNIQTLERRIGKLSGEASNEEVLEMDTKIKELSKELKDKTETHEMLKTQNKRVQVWLLVFLTLLQKPPLRIS